MSRVPPNNPHVLLLSCGIGRGHPFYLDGIQQALLSEYPDIFVEYRTVFELANPPALIGWKLARLLYHFGSQGGMKTELYETIRKGDRRSEPAEYLKNGLVSKVARYRDAGTIVIVDHPLLAVNLAELEVWYQHGELVAPESSIVDPGGKILVPFGFVASDIQEGLGIEDRVITTQCCIELEIEEEIRVRGGDRSGRLKNNEKLCIPFFTSGAEPSPHVDLILHTIPGLLRAGHHVILYAPEDGKLLFRIKTSEPHIFNGLELITYSNRQELHHETITRWSSFDFFMAPYHERLHWAIAAGIPMFGYLPTIGPFAALNREYGRSWGVSIDLTPEKADVLPDLLREDSFRKELRYRLALGFQQHLPGGFRKIAKLVADELKHR